MTTIQMKVGQHYEFGKGGNHVKILSAATEKDIDSSNFIGAHFLETVENPIDNAHTLVIKIAVVEGQMLLPFMFAGNDQWQLLKDSDGEVLWEGDTC